MRHTSMKLSAAALTSVLMVGCGGGSDTDEDIKGADKPSSSPTPSPTEETPDDFKRSSLSLPKDLKIDFDWDPPEGKAEAAALENAANYIRSIARGVSQQDAEDPAYKFYSAPLKQAQDYAKDQIEQYVKGGWTLMGVDRFSNPQVNILSKREKAVVTFCNDQAKIFGKEVKTGKRVEEGEGKRYAEYEILMASVPRSGGLWHAETINVKGQDQPC